ncbi:RNA polymerase sigma factor [Roseibium sp. RKSG952]|uniref:RNA polymerase sigma factor n=1 Tax=Roseibium sp. RKSG952 TaxID=2529384 RepID=UPI001AD8B025|nr:sigma factor-like helix-turn-helix DNA-binding protein [Roseibium sp. RKSG952]
MSPFRDPASLLDRLHATTGDQVQKNRILAALVETAQADDPASECALTLLLLALWPGLDAIRRRSLSRRLGTDDEIASDLLARTTEKVRGLDLKRVNSIAATVLRNIERDMIRARQRDIAREKLASSRDPDEMAGCTKFGIGATGYMRLYGAVREQFGKDALLVCRVAIEGFSQAEAAVELGLTEAAARKRYQRAMHRLREALEKTS